MRKIWIIIALALTLTGCKSSFDVKPDTIVDIPLHPTEKATEEQTEPDSVPEETEILPTETEPPTATEMPTEEPTKPASSGGSSGGKTPATQPPADPPTDPPTQPTSYDPSGYVPGSLDRALAQTINGCRQEAGLTALNLDTRLCAIASVRARELFANWSQSRPDGSSGISVLREYGYGYACAGENRHFGAASASSIVDKWMGAKAPKANILMEAADTIGVGSYKAPDGLTYVSVLIVG